MVDPISLSVLASSIVGFVFTAASTTVIEKATEATIEKLKKLTQMIRERLKSNPNVIAELDKKDDNDKDLETVRFYLEGEMRQHKDFADQVKSLFDEINKDLEDAGQGSNIMYVYGGNAFQQNQNQGTIKNYNAETMTFNEKE